MNGWTLRSFTFSAKVLLTSFLALVGTGYLFALGQIYSTHANRDGKEGMSFDDLKASFHGLTVEVDAARQARRPLPSRFLEMIEGDMREHVKTDEQFKVLYGWLGAGATKEAFAAGEQDKTPADVIRDRCLRCHAADGGEDIGKDSPFGPDVFTADFSMISEFTNTQPTAASSAPSGTAFIEPVRMPRLIMLTHAHMLAIPVFTLIVGMLFVLTHFPSPLKGLIAVIPMLAVIVDLGGWWVARWWEPALFGIAGAGAAFGACFAIQLLWVAGALWFGRKSDPSS